MNLIKEAISTITTIIALLFNFNGETNSTQLVSPPIIESKDAMISNDVYDKYLTELTTAPFLIPQLTIEKIYDKGNLYYNTLYTNTSYYIYIPNECNHETKTLVFNSGGFNGYELPYYYMLQYVKTEPNAVLLFFVTSGYTDIKTRTQLTFDVLNQISLERQYIAKDITLCGASLGVYTCLHEILDFQKLNLHTANLISLDAGCNWQDEKMLTLKEIKELAKIGTNLYLLEQPNTHNDIIQELIDNNCLVYIVECFNASHERIATHAFTDHFFDFVFGTVTQKELQLQKEYTFVTTPNNS